MEVLFKGSFSVQWESSTAEKLQEPKKLQHWVPKGDQTAKLNEGLDIPWISSQSKHYLVWDWDCLVDWARSTTAAL